MNKVFFFCAVFLFLAFKHPFYLSVTDLKYNAKEKAIQGTVKLFINDAETALRKITGKPVDLINSKDKDQTKKMLHDYLKTRLIVKLNKETKELDVLGYEIEEEAVWMYVEFKKCGLPRLIEVENTLLYDFIKNQTNIVHLEINGKTKSSKVNNPDKLINFEF